MASDARGRIRGASNAKRCAGTFRALNDLFYINMLMKDNKYLEIDIKRKLIKVPGVVAISVIISLTVIALVFANNGELNDIIQLFTSR